MEHMDAHQTPTLDEEQKKLKLHASDLEDDSSYPSKKRVKLDLPEEKPALADHRWAEMVDFRCPTNEIAQVYEDLVTECEKEIKAYDDSSHLFNTKFGNLEKILPCTESSTVVSLFRFVQESAKKSLDMAYNTLPAFKEHVDNYVKFINGPLSNLQLAEDRYIKKLEEFVEIPNVVKMLKELLYYKDVKKIEDRTKLTQRDINGIVFYLWKNKDIEIPDEKEDVMNEEPDGESEMEDLLKALKKEVPLLRADFEKAEADVKKHVEKYEYGFDCVLIMEDHLDVVDCRVRRMRRQLELLLHKGYDEDFDDDWSLICRDG